MIVLVSLIVLLKGFPCFHNFLHDASLHPYEFFHLYIYRASCAISLQFHGGSQGFNCTIHTHQNYVECTCKLYNNYNL